MCSDTSLLRLLTLPSRMPLRSPSPPPRMPARPRSSPWTSCLVVWPEPCLSSSSTLLTTPEPGENNSDMVSGSFILIQHRLANDAKGKGGERQFNGLIDVYTKTLKSDGIQGLYRGFAISAVGIFIYRGMYFGLFDTLKPLLLGDSPNVTLSFLLGWGVTITAGLMSYPIGKILIWNVIFLTDILHP